MAFIQGKDTVVYFNESDYSTYFSSVDLSATADVAESTTFGNTSKTYIAGERDGTIGLTGFFDATADTQFASVYGTSFNLVVGHDGITTGKRASFAKSLITNYGVSSPVGDIVASSLDVQADDGLHNGSVLINGAFTATAVQGSAQDNTTSTSNGLGAFLIATSVSGTSPTADVKIQHSADNSTWVDLVTFTQVTAASSEIKEVEAGTTINRYLRVFNTIGGSSTPTVNAIVGISRNN
tara:strand:- start:7079 stop:7792 length:714 start_codon:yes stop_codon:yes gene_type:complete